jgi:Diguanylate cyclase, GGDEF domain
VILRDVTLEHEVQETLADMANTDALTGLANRRGLAHRAREIWLRAHELQQPLTALFIDVDHFKSFNDHFGHQAGDACLRDVADVLQHLADPRFPIRTRGPVSSRSASASARCIHATFAARTPTKRSPSCSPARTGRSTPRKPKGAIGSRSLSTILC